jgi:branched-chain amino acid transport system ATP-binding protein
LHKPEPILETIEVTKRFGMVTAADSTSVSVNKGDLIGIVGSNGSGKTTFINMITGYIKPDKGRVLFLGKDITPYSPRHITKMGIARSFQIPQLYFNMTVLENLLLSYAAMSNGGNNIWQPLHKKEWLNKACETLKRFGLSDCRDQRVLHLPEGHRKVLDIALSFALEPMLILMDEPTSSVSIEDKFPIMDTLIRVVEESHITTIFVEHDMDVISRYSRRVIAFHEGKVLADGTPQEVLGDEDVKRIVLGVSEAC